MKEEILSYLPDASVRQDHIFCFDSIDSTNTYLAALAKNGAPHGTVVIADTQTAGRGRMGRSFHSPSGMGLYMSVLLRPDCLPCELMHLTCACAVAACDAIEHSVGIRPGIKWTNDLVFEKRKLAGILTELSIGKSGALSYAIVGIGINCCQTPDDFPSDLRSTATSLLQITEKTANRALLAAKLIESMLKMSDSLFSEKEEMMRTYRRDCITIGCPVSILRADRVSHATAVDMDDNGALIVAYPDGTIETVNSGEVSVRGMYGYV